MCFKVLIVDDEFDYLNVLSKILTKNGFQVEVAQSPKEALEKLETTNIDVILSEMIMGEINGIDLLKITKKEYPEIEFILITGFGSYATAVEAVKNGAFSYFSKGSDLKELLTELDKLREIKKVEQSSVTPKLTPVLYSRNQKIQNIFFTLDKIAKTDITVLLTGESGVGKEIFANYIHNNSKRAANDYITVSCSSLSKNLIESELFGYEKGAFTGANKTRIGRFEAADNGTIFLDEIGEIDSETQVKLLRVLESKTIERVGSQEPIELDTRLIFATNRDLNKEIAENQFRKDLFYRINSITITIPPLRERKEDIPILTDYFIQHFSQKYGKNIKGTSNELANYFLQYEFPGNIRELRNIIERLVVLSESDILSFSDLPNGLAMEDQSLITFETEDFTLKTLRQEVEKKYILKLMEKYDTNLNEIADHLKITRRHLLNKLKELDIKY